MFSNFRLLGLIIVCIMMLYRANPVATAITMLLLIGAILFFKYYMPAKTVQNGRVARREAALKRAKVFLAPYEDIWRDLKLSNSFCYLTLAMDGMTIEGFEKTKGGTFRTFKVLKSNVHDWEDLWNLFFKNFGYNKSYDGLLEDCRRFNLVVEEKLYEKPIENEIPAIQSVTKKVDINNCTEKEMADLPGVSIIMAKKAIKNREENDGFKSLEDFYETLKLQPNMQEQLRDIIYLGERLKKQQDNISPERRVDF